MGYLMFYLAAVAACLLWSTACVAAAARTERAWLRRLLAAVAVVVPPLGLAPWVWITGGLAALGLRTNWFAPTLTAFIAAVIGGLWITAAGLSRRSPGGVVAAAWPVVGLAAGFVLAKACTLGTLLFIDNAVAAEGRMLRVEAAQIMSNALPPAPAPDDNAAPLYQRAFASLASDKQVEEPESPFWNASMADAGSPEVTAILERHAGTLDLLRRATDKPGCRFDRDWSRPSFDMPLLEVQAMRRAARLLMLSARRAAAAGDGAQAIADVVRIHHLGLHAASEPMLVSGLVGQAIDAVAMTTLADVLPRLDKDDLPILDDESLRDFVATPVRYQQAFLGEEACGLATLGDLADGAGDVPPLEFLRSVPDDPSRFAFDGPFSFLYRCFMLPADIAGYRAVMRRYQAVSGSMTESGPKSAPQIVKEMTDIETEITSRRPGVFAALLTPALSGVITSQSKGEALHDVAGVLVAATRARLAGASLADSLVPGALPGDPFTEDKTLLAKRTDDGWAVYSVGPDGEDDGGPVPPDADDDESDDDVGLWMAQAGSGE